MKTSTLETKLNIASPPPFIVDTTLRDGEQSPGLVFSLEEKTLLLSRLLDTGVKEFEIGIPAMGDDAVQDISILQKLGSRRGARMICWARCVQSDIDACSAADATAIHMSLPVSDLQMNIIGMNRTTVLDRLNAGLKRAKDRFEFVSIGAQDSTRADKTFLLQYIDTALQMGAERIRIADTVGCANPIETHRLLQQIQAAFPLAEFEFHAHNDFGMAVANAIAAIQGGASAVSTTVLGIGERAGNAPFEAVVVAAKEILGIDFNIDTKSLYPLCRDFSSSVGIQIPSSHPVVGGNVLTHESGIHTHGQLSHPKAFQPILAEDVGRTQPKFVYGAHSGSYAVKQLLKNRTPLDFSDAIAKRVTGQIKHLARLGRSGLTEQDVLALAAASPRGPISG